MPQRIPRRRRFIGRVKKYRNTVYIAIPRWYLEFFWEEDPLVEVVNLGKGKLFIKAFPDVRSENGDLKEDSRDHV
jgi:hypothetical protein